MNRYRLSYSILQGCSVCLFAAILAACASTSRDSDSQEPNVVVSIADQKLIVLSGVTVSHEFSVSTSRYGVGEITGGDTTPRGLHQIVEKIGHGEPVGMVFESRLSTGEIVEVNTPNRWPVITRILRLGGLDHGNANSYDRMIYIHGTPVEKLLGTPASGGCIRMRSSDVLVLFDVVSIGTRVNIVEEKIGSFLERAASR